MGSDSNQIHVAVIGAGTMGAGIAQVAAAAGSEVVVIDVSADVLKRATDGIKSNLDRLVQKGKLPLAEAESIARRVTTKSKIENLYHVDLVIEAIIEDVRAKHVVLGEVDLATADDTVLASNTSSLSIDKIADSIRHPGRVIGMHFFNPAPLMPLVEVIAGNRSEKAHVDFGLTTARAWGKTAVLAKDTPGFIVNRVARGYYLEALRLLDEGVGGIDEIDTIMRTHGGFKMGPFELVDLVGLDVNLAVSTSVWEQMGKPARLTPHPIQQKLVAAGHLGRKTNRGFYIYQDGHALPAHQVERRSFRLAPMLIDVIRVFCESAGAEGAGTTEQYIFARILSAILNEAGFAFSEKVANSDDIDLAMMKGTNYPKGPLAWADEIGFRNVRGTLWALNDQAGDNRYEPSPLFANAP